MFVKIANEEARNPRFPPYSRFSQTQIKQNSYIHAIFNLKFVKVANGEASELRRTIGRRETDRRVIDSSKQNVVRSLVWGGNEEHKITFFFSGRRLGVVPGPTLFTEFANGKPDIGMFRFVCSVSPLFARRSLPSILALNDCNALSADKPQCHLLMLLFGIRSPSFCSFLVTLWHPPGEMKGAPSAIEHQQKLL